MGSAERSTTGDSDRFAVGVIGAGWITSIYHLPILSYFDETSVKYVADVDGTKAKYLSEAYGASSITIDEDVSRLPDCDVAVLAIPVGARDEYLQEFARRDTPVFCEKPFAIDESAHREFLELPNALFCNYQRTCYSAVIQLKKILQSGLFGRLETATVNEGVVGGPDTGIGSDHYRTDLSLSGGGILMEMGCHTLSELVHVFEGWDLSVDAVDITWNEVFDVDVDAVLTAAGEGRNVDITYRISSIRNLGRRATFTFENAEVVFNTFEAEQPLYVRRRDTDSFALAFEPSGEWATSQHQGVYLRWKQFVADLRNDSVTDHVRTAPEVSELITELYETAGRPQEVSKS